MKKIFVVDVMGYIFRSYHAIRQMTNAKGESTNAVFGFVRSILKLCKDFECDHLVAVFDGPNNERKFNMELKLLNTRNLKFFRNSW